MYNGLTDIHTHILPEIDDGSRSIEMTKGLLLRQKEIGVERIFLTSHFYCHKEALESFLKRREEAKRKLDTVWTEGMPLVKLGAEVHFALNLLEMDINKLTLGDSRYLLLELSFNHYPALINNAVEEILSRGIVPIIAHIERYPYFEKQPELLMELLDMGALAQVNIEDVKPRSFAKASLEHSMAHFIASDTHNLTARPPILDKMKSVKNYELYEKFAQCVWDDADTPDFEPTLPKKGPLGYK